MTITPPSVDPRRRLYVDLQALRDGLGWRERKTFDRLLASAEGVEELERELGDSAFEHLAAALPGILREFEERAEQERKRRERAARVVLKFDRRRARRRKAP